MSKKIKPKPMYVYYYIHDNQVKTLYTEEEQELADGLWSVGLFTTRAYYTDFEVAQTALYRERAECLERRVGDLERRFNKKPWWRFWK